MKRPHDDDGDDDRRNDGGTNTADEDVAAAAEMDEETAHYDVTDEPDDVDESDEGGDEGMPSHLTDFEIDLDAPQGYRYLDHTADVQLHAWGPSLEHAFEEVVVAMFGYMTDLRMVEIDESATTAIEASGHDLPSLLFKFLDEALFLFSTQYTVFKEIKVTKLDLQKFTIIAEGKGETFDLQKHPQGTEVKAITYSNMQIFTSAPPDAQPSVNGNAGDDSATAIVRPCTVHGRHELYVIVDI